MFALDGTAGFQTNYTNQDPDDHNNNVVAINGTAMVHGEWTNMLAVGGKVSNRSTGETYPGGGQNFVYSGPLATFPIIVPNTVVALCGQRLAGSQDIFETSGNITCVS
jgi:hypothetical protein